MKIIDYVVNGTYKTVKVATYIDSYEYIKNLEKSTFVIRRVIYG